MVKRLHQKKRKKYFFKLIKRIKCTIQIEYKNRYQVTTQILVLLDKVACNIANSCYKAVTNKKFEHKKTCCFVK